MIRQQSQSFNHGAGWGFGMGRESGLLWPRVRSLAKQSGITMHRVETAFDDGFPDVAWCSDKCEGAFLELKIAHARVRLPPRIDFRPAQVPWLMAWSRHGGRCGVIAEFDSVLYLIPGSRSLALSNIGLTKDLWQYSVPLYATLASHKLYDAIHSLEK